MHWIEKEEHHRLLQNAVTTTYERSNKETARIINSEGIKFIKKANILDKVKVNGNANYFISLKDHMVNFLKHPTTRLINPAKKKISEQVLDKKNGKNK